MKTPMLWRQLKCYYRFGISLSFFFLRVFVFVCDGFIECICSKFDTSAKIDLTLVFPSVFHLSIHLANHPFSHHSMPKQSIPCTDCKEQTLLRHISEIDSVK